MFTKCPKCGLISNINQPHEIEDKLILYCENCDDNYQFDELSVFVKKIVSDQLNSSVPPSLSEIKAYLELKQLNEQTVFANPMN